MFVGQIGVVAWFVLRQEGPIDIAAAVHVVGGGLTISLSVIMGLPAVLAALWIAIRISRTPFADYLALRWPSWTDSSSARRAVRSGHGVGPAVARGWDAKFAGIHGRGAEFGARRRLAMAAGDRILVAAPISEEFFARGFLYRGWSESFLRPAGASCCRRWCGRRCICNTTGSFSARCFRSACCSVTSAIASIRPG